MAVYSIVFFYVRRESYVRPAEAISETRVCKLNESESVSVFTYTVQS